MSCVTSVDGIILWYNVYVMYMLIEQFIVKITEQLDVQSYK